MATTVASIVFQLLILGTVVHLSYGDDEGPKCWHSFRHVNHKNGSELPQGFKQIFENDWKRGQIKDQDTKPECAQPGVKGCETITCTNPDGSDVFRITGCQKGYGECTDEFKQFCAQTYKCEKCDKDQGDLCNNQKDLVQPPQPKKTTLNIHIESMPINGATGAMPTTAIGTASAKLIIAIIGNAVLLLTMLGHHNAVIF